MKRPKPAQNNDRVGALKNFKVGPNGSKVGLDTLKVPRNSDKNPRGIDFDQKKVWSQNDPLSTFFALYRPYVKSLQKAQISNKKNKDTFEAFKISK